MSATPSTAALASRRATSIVPLASRTASPLFARRLPQNLITGASATTPAKALQLSEIIGKSTEVDFSKTLVDETLAWPKVEAFQPTTAIEADTAIHTPQFLGFDVLRLSRRIWPTARESGVPSRREPACRRASLSPSPSYARSSRSRCK